MVVLVVPWVATAAWLLAANHSWGNAQSSAGGNGNVGSNLLESKPGPWGSLLYAKATLELPDEFTLLPKAGQPPICWFFPAFSKEETSEFLKTSGVPQAEIDRVIVNVKDIAAEPGKRAGTSLYPSDEFILGLSPAARAKIYALLIECPENEEGMYSCWFDAETVDTELSDSQLAPESIKLLKSLFFQYPGSNLFLFVDRCTAVRKLPNDRERRLFTKAITNKTTLFVRLKITPQTDIDALAGYWGVGGRRKDLLPLFNSAQSIENGWNLSLVYLLPPFMRNRLYTYPFPSVDPTAIKQDCLWSTFNVFNETPDNQFVNMDYAQKKLEQDYYQIFEPSQLGDVILLTTAKGQAIHAASYIADDIVFTKNGGHFEQPWILMHQKDMLKTYNVRYPVSGPLTVLYFRKKSI
jgi:hypothetical protein